MTGKTKMQFRFICDILVEADDLFWGDPPENPTVEDVRKLADELGYDRMLELEHEDFEIYPVENLVNYVETT